MFFGAILLNFDQYFLHPMSIYIKTFILFLIVLLQTTCLKAQSSIEFIKTFGANSNDFYTSIGSDGGDGIFLLGYSSSNYGIFNQNKGKYDIVIHQVNQTGDLINNINDGSIQNDVSNSLINLDEKLYIATYSNAQEEIASKISSFDTELNKTQDIDLNLEGADYPKKMIPSLDGNFFICGNSNGAKNRFGGWDIYVSKYSSTGSLMWQQSYGGQKLDAVNGLLELNDGSLILTGFTYSDDGFINESKGKKDAWVMKLSSSGEKLWAINLGTEGFETLVDAQLSNDGILLAGTKGVFDYSNPISKGIYQDQIWLVKINFEGLVQWEKTYGGLGNERTCAFIKTNEGYLISATSDSKDGLSAGNKGKTDALILSIDANGEILWNRLLGGEGKDELSTAFQDSKGKLWLAGYTDSKNGDIPQTFGEKDGWLVKLEGTAPSFSLNLGQDRSICLGENVSIDATLPTCNCSYLWSDGSTQSIKEISPTEDITYGLTITDDQGNSASDGINIIVNPLPNADWIANDPTCAGIQNGSIQLNNVSGQDPIQFSWNGFNGSDRLLNLGAGSFELTLLDANQCTNSFAFELNEPELLLVTADINALACNGNATGSITLSVDGGLAPYTYLWSTGAREEKIEHLEAGLYEVTITDANECELIESYTLNDVSGISIAVSTERVSCFGGADGQLSVAVVGGSGVYDFSWNNGASESELDQLSAGFYILTLTDSNDCETITQIQIHEPSEIIVSETLAMESCFESGDGSIEILVEGGTGTYTYLWNNDNVDQNQYDLSAGIYSVIVKDENACEQTFEFILAPKEELVLESQLYGSYCNGSTDGSIELNVLNAQGELNIEWDNDLEGLNPQNLSAGTYEVNITDENGCSVSEIFELFEAPEIEVVYDLENASCFEGANGFIEITEIIGKGPFVINWDSGIEDLKITDLSAGLHSVTILDANDCSKVFDFEIEEPVELNVELTTENVICFGEETGSATAMPSGGTAPYTYSWYDADLNELENVESLSMLKAGVYNLLVIDANACEFETSFEIEESERLSPSFQIRDATCPGIDNGMLKANLENESDYNFAWSNGGQGSSIENLGAGNFFLSVTNDFGCETVFQFFVKQPSPFELVYGLQDEKCYGDHNGEIAVSFSGGTEPYNYLWSNGQTEAFIKELIPGTYDLNISDDNDCTFDTSFVVEEASEIFIDETLVDADKDLENGSITLEVNGGVMPYRIMWNNGREGEELNNLSSGTYSFTLTDGVGCKIFGGYEIEEIIPTAYSLIQKKTFEIYPNPTTGILNIEKLSNNKDFEVKIFDVNGHKRKEWNYNNGLQSFSLDVKDLNAGIYFVEIKEFNTISRVKIIVQKAY